MTTTSIWAPIRVSISEADLLARVAGMTWGRLVPGDQRLLDLLSEISKAIFADRRARQIPQYVALGYWLREAALRKIARDHLPELAAGCHLVIPRGRTLHLPPTNVDTIFVYSWALSILAGNANIVRLSDKSSLDNFWLAETIARVIERHGLSDSQIFCQYQYGDDLEVAISRQCDLRMIWGGDAKVELVSRTPIRLDGISIGFPDRKSISVIDVEAYRHADEAARDELASRLYNDIYWFSQMACGSPRLLVWVGGPCETLANDLYTRIGHVIARKALTVELAVSMGKLSLANDFLAEGLAGKLVSFSNELVVVRVADPSAVLERSHGGGFLCECHVADVADIAGFATRKLQTLGHFGLCGADLERLARAIAGLGGYRLVPIGEALQFEADWDGVPLLTHMTRRVTIRGADTPRP